MSTMVYAVYSWVLGLLDRSYSIIVGILGSKRPMFFNSGWGNERAAVKSLEDLVKCLDLRQSGKGYRYNIEGEIKWDKPVESGSVVATEGRFQSPVAGELPDIAKECQFFLIEPTPRLGEEENGHVETVNRKTRHPPDVVVIMLPATGESSKRARLSMARRLAEDYGWSSVIVTAPFYGARKPSGQTLFFVDNVKDFLLQSVGVMEEAAALTCYFMKQSPRTRVCVTGFSWGGAMAACAASISLLSGCDGRRLACVAYAGSATPEVLQDGLLASSVDWEALKESQFEPIEHVQTRLSSILRRFHLSELTDLIEKKRSILSEDEQQCLLLGRSKVVAMHHDHIIRPSFSKDLIAPVNSISAIKSSPQWLPGGHVMAALLKHRAQLNAIVETVQSLE